MSKISHASSGPIDAKVVLVGEAPGDVEMQRGKPFVGPSGYQLDRMLADAGLNRADVLVTNVCNYQPPGNDINLFFHTAKEAKLLQRQPFNGRYPNAQLTEGIHDLHTLLGAHERNVVVPMGNAPLWALSGEEGILKWRGSVLRGIGGHYKLVPTMHPAFILREWTYRPILVQDFRRVSREARHPDLRKPSYSFVVRPSFSEVDVTIGGLLARNLPISVDIETRNGQIACLGIGWSDTDALCIPFMQVEGEGSYWSPEDETAIVLALRTLLTSIPCIFHNGLFDCQYIARQWGYLPRFDHDTMLMQHVLFPGLLGGRIDPIDGTVSKKGSSLSLLFLSSMYCAYHRYWKDDGRKWDPLLHPEDQYWTYNCEDCVRTYECWRVLTNALDQTRLTEQYDFERDLFSPVLEMMFRGIRIDQSKLAAMRLRVQGEMADHLAWINTALGHEFNPRSAAQMKEFFYQDLKLAPLLHRKTKKPTLNDDALMSLKKKNPLLRPLINRIEDYKSLSVIYSNILSAKLSPDGRMRCAFNVAGPETFRFSCNTTTFEEGFNLQTVPKTFRESE